MADLTIPNTFVDGTDIEADEHNANMTAVANWVNTEAVRADGTIAFSTLPALPAADPTSDTEPAHKGYVDKKAGGVVIQKTYDTAGAMTTYSAASAVNTWYGLAANGLDFNYTLEQNHWYTVELLVPLHAVAEADRKIGIATRQDGVVMGEAWHFNPWSGSGLTDRATRTWQHTAADVSKAFTAVGMYRGTAGSLALQHGSHHYGGAMTHTLIDHGIA